MKFQKAMIVIAILAVSSVALFANGGKDAGPVTINFMCTEADLTADQVAKFNAANPDINLVRVEERRIPVPQLVGQISASTGHGAQRNETEDEYRPAYDRLSVHFRHLLSAQH